MKYDLLEPFDDYLQENLNKNTARKYYSSVKSVLGNIQFNSIEEVRKEHIEEELLKLKTKNDFSAAKNGLLHLKKLYNNLDLPDDSFFRITSSKKRNRSKKPKKNIYLDKTKRKINQISNPKLKLAYRLALVSGLRVSELAGLEKQDINLVNDKIEVNVRYGKGGSNGLVTCMDDPYLKKNLFMFIENLKDDEKIFYSEVHMRKEALELGLECHDFRRISAITYRNLMKESMSVYDANQEVKSFLRHKRFSTTKRYLFNKKLIIKEKENHERS